MIKYQLPPLDNAIAWVAYIGRYPDHNPPEKETFIRRMVDEAAADASEWNKKFYALIDSGENEDSDKMYYTRRRACKSLDRLGYYTRQLVDIVDAK